MAVHMCGGDRTSLYLHRSQKASLKIPLIERREGGRALEKNFCPSSAGRHGLMALPLVGWGFLGELPGDRQAPVGDSTGHPVFRFSCAPIVLHVKEQPHAWEKIHSPGSTATQAFT